MNKILAAEVGAYLALGAIVSVAGWQLYKKLSDLVPQSVADTVKRAVDAPGDLARGYERSGGNWRAAIGEFENPVCENPKDPNCVGYQKKTHRDLVDEQCYPVAWDPVSQTFVRTGPQDDQCLEDRKEDN